MTAKNCIIGSVCLELSCFHCNIFMHVTAHICIQIRKHSSNIIKQSSKTINPVKLSVSLKKLKTENCLFFAAPDKETHFNDSRKWIQNSQKRKQFCMTDCRVYQIRCLLLTLLELLGAIRLQFDKHDFDERNFMVFTLYLASRPGSIWAHSRVLLPHARFPARVSPSVTDFFLVASSLLSRFGVIFSLSKCSSAKSGAKLLNINKRQRAIATVSSLSRFLSPQPIARRIYVVPFSYSARDNQPGDNGWNRKDPARSDSPGLFNPFFLAPFRATVPCTLQREAQHVYLPRGRLPSESRLTSTCSIFAEVADDNVIYTRRRHICMYPPQGRTVLKTMAMIRFCVLRRYY